MKGIIFTEFLAMVEDTWGLATLDDLLERTTTATNGAYTSVGNYASDELLAMVGALASLTAEPPHALVEAFGRHLAASFVAKFPQFFADTGSVFDVLKRVDQLIHIEVCKLYSEATPPRFTVAEVGPSTLVVHYESKRDMALVAQGIIAGCAQHFDETLTITREDLPFTDKHRATFTLRRAP